MNRIIAVPASFLVLVAAVAGWKYSDHQASETWEITGEILGCELFLVANVEPLWSKPGYGTEFMGTYESETRCPPEITAELQGFEADKGILSARLQGEDELVIRFWDPGATSVLSSDEVTGMGRRTGTIHMCVPASAGADQFSILKSFNSGEDPLEAFQVMERHSAVLNFLWTVTPKCFLGSFSMVKK